VKFKNVSAGELFEIYTDSEKHGGAVKSTATINDEGGREFWVFGKNGLRGKTLYDVAK
jgi:hypothetical protein